MEYEPSSIEIIHPGGDGEQVPARLAIPESAGEQSILDPLIRRGIRNLSLNLNSPLEAPSVGFRPREHLGISSEMQWEGGECHWAAHGRYEFCPPGADEFDPSCTFCVSGIARVRIWEHGHQIELEALECLGIEFAELRHIVRSGEPWLGLVEKIDA